jgi:hypothetical protein
MKEIKIKNVTNINELNFEIFQTELSNIKISEINFGLHLLVEIKNNNLTNLIDFTGADDLKILYVVNDLAVGGTFAINNNSGFLIQTEYKHILLSKF